MNDKINILSVREIGDIAEIDSGPSVVYVYLNIFPDPGVLRGFADVLRTSTRIKLLDVQNITLDLGDIGYLFDALSVNMSVKTFRISFRPYLFEFPGFLESVCQCISQNRCIKTFSFDVQEAELLIENAIPDAIAKSSSITKIVVLRGMMTNAGGNMLVRIIKENPRLTSLNVVGDVVNGVFENVTLAIVGHPGLEVVDFSGLTSGYILSTKFIIEMVRLNTTLKKLDFRSIRIVDGALSDLGHALRTNRTLKDLSFGTWNEEFSDTWMAFARGISDNKHLFRLFVCYDRPPMSDLPPPPTMSYALHYIVDHNWTLRSVETSCIMNDLRLVDGMARNEFIQERFIRSVLCVVWGGKTGQTGMLAAVGPHISKMIAQRLFETRGDIAWLNAYNRQNEEPEEKRIRLE